MICSTTGAVNQTYLTNPNLTVNLVSNRVFLSSVISSPTTPLIRPIVNNRYTARLFEKSYYEALDGIPSPGGQENLGQFG